MLAYTLKIEAVDEPQSSRGAGDPAGSTEAPLALETLTELPMTFSGRQWPWRGLLFALFAHGAVLGAVMWSPENDAAGGGNYPDAIEVSVVDERVLEARFEAAKADAAAVAAAVSVMANDGAQVQAETSAPTPDAHPNAAERPRKLTVLTVPESTLSLPPTPPELLEPASKSDPGIVTLTAPAPAQTAIESTQGGAAARGVDSLAAPVTAGAQAPPGTVKAYAASVMRVLAHNKPTPQTVSGTTRVRFTVGGDGQVSELEVLRSSGSAKLDAAAMAALRRVQFPAPPVALSRLQTTYDLPFHFR